MVTMKITCKFGTIMCFTLMTIPWHPDLLMNHPIDGEVVVILPSKELGLSLMGW
jgi:hypothetical protein